MKHIHIVCVGKLREVAYKEVEQQYLSRLSTFKTAIHELKSRDDNTRLEGQDVVKKIEEIQKKQNFTIVLLTEKGQQFNSPQFSQWLFNGLAHNSGIILVIGGAAGHGQDVYNIKNKEISLSPLTFPHHMVRALLAEQLYRAETIYQGHPYSK